jgi:hypothetical protein
VFIQKVGTVSIFRILEKYLSRDTIPLTGASVAQDAVACMLLQRILGTGSHLKYGGSQGKLAKAAAAASAANQSVAGKTIFLISLRNVPYHTRCCGSGMFIPDPRSKYFSSRIRIKNLRILTQKIVSKLSEI